MIVGVVNIMALGDSLTSNANGAYRVKAASDLMAIGKFPQWIGTVEDGTTIETWDRWGHEGHSGYTTTQLRDGLRGWAQSLHSRPRYVFLLAGVNDLSSGAQDPQANYLSLLHEIASVHPMAHTLCSTLAPWIGHSSEIHEFNSALADTVIAAKMSGIDCDLYNVGGQLSDGDISGDGVHPTADGYIALGSAWITHGYSVAVGAGR